jgi:hypothetical protein
MESIQPALALARNDMAYHQIRVLILVAAISSTKGHGGKLDGLTKLAKLDFLLRYPALAPKILDRLSPGDARLHLTRNEVEHPTIVESPMIRYKFGPWDDRYYPTIGALVGRGLVKYVKGRRGSVAMTPTAMGKRLCKSVAATDSWRHVADRAEVIAEGSIGFTGTNLKDLVYERLPELMNRPHREVIR